MSEPHPGYFTAPLADTDPEVATAIADEAARQNDQIELIASENIVSRAVLEAQGSILTNKTIEGYPGRRYHGGAANVDIIEKLAVDRACRLFSGKFANVQPHSGSQANHAVLLALIRPGETLLSMDLASGGHLSHGAAPNLSGKWFNAQHYGVRRQDGLIDYDEVERLAAKHAPKLIIAGGSAYPRAIDFERFRAIADSCGASLLVDMAHFAGLVAGDVHPSPIPHAHVVTTTTYKSLRGARGGLILTDDEALARKLDAAMFPGLQGSPLLHAIAAKAVCLGEALRPEFKVYAQRVLENARALAETLVAGGLSVVTGGTDTPLMLVDLHPLELTGDVTSESLERAGLTANKNAVPFDPQPPAVTSGLRLGVSAGTTRGFGTAEFKLIGETIVEVLQGLQAAPADNGTVEAGALARISALSQAFPIYQK